ncbi:fasciclin domain-containing protein [Ruegeria sp. 2205SS24-7]|uniref:fasciclin domain-containing protein n=1 Tax=Ruegeria discodermiae TaxID=3064389 RepID=UPI002740838F|nr:fasciclin domain-containing protein [Ruegeria sp. 2205SS24-7]MDP5215781.1 fasciclin domain-containing protein [Ruegeria sp. 2205SS24-7]
MDATQTLTGIVLNSGAPGTFDNNNGDFDLLREAVITAGLADALNDDAASLTVFAPTDAAFIGLASALGFDGDDEAGALTHIVEALTLLGGGDPIPLLTDVLTYHVVNGAFDLEAVAGLGNGAEIGTLQGGAVTLNLESMPPSLGDADDGIADPGLIAFDIKATNGIIHVLDGVLLPVSVTGILSQPDTDFILDDDGNSFNFTGRGNDFIDGNGGRDIIWAGSGNDIVLGGTGNDVIGGGRGKDILRGDEGHDKIFGGGGKDVVDGGEGNDYIFGGWGKDSFVFENGDGRDTILDFRVGSDKIDLTGYEGIHDFHDIEDDISARFFRTVIELDDGDQISLFGVRAHQLDADDFLFA